MTARGQQTTIVALTVTCLIIMATLIGTITIARPSDLHIVWERGSDIFSDETPSYGIILSGDGVLTYTTDFSSFDASGGPVFGFSDTAGTPVRGTYQTQLSQTAMHQIQGIIQRAAPFSYNCTNEDQPTDAVIDELIISQAAHYQHMSTATSCWSQLAALIREIEAAAGIEAWREGSTAVISKLAHQGVNFDSYAGYRLLRQARQRGDAAAIRQLETLIGPTRDETAFWEVYNAAQAEDQQALDSAIQRRLPQRSRTIALEAFNTAVRSNRTASAERLLALISGGLTADEATATLREASKNANISLMRRAMAFGANVNDLDAEHLRYPPLYYAVRSPDTFFSPNDRSGALQAVSLLIAHGADPNTRIETPYNSAPIIRWAASEDIVLALLDAGANREAVQQPDGSNLRQWARQRNWTRVSGRLR